MIISKDPFGCGYVDFTPWSWYIFPYRRSIFPVLGSITCVIGLKIEVVYERELSKRLRTLRCTSTELPLRTHSQ